MRNRIKPVAVRVEHFVGSRKPEVILLIILSFSLLLRIPKIGSRSIWYDDVFSIFLSQQTPTKIISGTAPDTNPPLYYFLMHGWMLINQQIWFLRAQNVIISLGIVALVYVVSKRCFGQSAGVLAAVFTAVSPLQIYYAQELRMYALAALVLLGYTYFFLQLWDERNSKHNPWVNWLGLILLGSISVYTQSLAIFSIVVPNLILIFHRKWRFLVRLILAQIVIGLLSSPWLVFVPGQIDKIQTAFWTPQPGLLPIIQAIVAFHTNLPVPEWMLPIAIFTSFLMFVLVFYETIKTGKLNNAVTALLAFTLIPPLLLFIISYFMQPIFVPKAFMLSSLTYYALAGRAVSLMRSRVLVLAMILIFILPALAVLPAQYAYEKFPRSPFEAAAKALKHSFSNGDVIIHDNKLSHFPMHYYQIQLPQTFIADLPGSHNDTLALGSQIAMNIFPSLDMETAVSDAKHVWFVVFERAIEEYKELGQSDHPKLAWLSERFDLFGVRKFNDLWIYEFNR